MVYKQFMILFRSDYVTLLLKLELTADFGICGGGLHV